MKIKLLSVFFILCITLFFTSCGISEADEIKEPGKIKIVINFDYDSNFEGGILLTKARDFTVFNNEKFAPVYQTPEQFLAYEDSIKTFNIFGEIKGIYPGGKNLRVAYGYLPEGVFNQVKFQITPNGDLTLNGLKYPIVKNNAELSHKIEEKISSLVELNEKIEIKSGRTTVVTINFYAKDCIYRVLDQFVFNPKIKNYKIELEP